MMLQIGHRDSRDVDIFLSDPQLLGYLDPNKQNFTFEIAPDDSTSDGTRFQKFSFADIGEIDFIIAPALTTSPTIHRKIEGNAVLLETVAEIITKKIVHRGSTIAPRDIFDIAAASADYADAVTTELRTYRDAVAATIEQIERRNPEFVANTISQLMVRPEFQLIAKTASARALELLRAV